MTLEYFSKNIVPILTLLMSGVGVISLILVWHQIRLANIWNKLNTQNTLLANLPKEEHEKYVWGILSDVDKDLDGNISEKSAADVYDDNDKFISIKGFLNSFEIVCAALNAGSIDEDYAYSVHGARITHAFERFRNFIEHVRSSRDNLEVYIELEKVAVRWIDRQNSEREKRAMGLRQIKNNAGTNTLVR